MGDRTTSPSWRGPAQFAGTALGLTLLVMALTRPAPVCEMAAEPHRRLDLARTVDSEHLDTDVRDADRVARRYASQGPARPEAAGADSVCRAKLAAQISATHDVPLSAVSTSAPVE